MCGIAGWVGADADEQVVAAMVEVLKARGPDGDSVKRIASQCVFGHTRLAIVDLSSAGDQPMHDGSGAVWAVVNGEIYNHLALRRELEGSGSVFKSNCDSEVVVHGFSAWGCDVVSKLRGIFALAIYDVRADQLILARDRVGVKPLYYADTGKHFLFASELKAIVSNGSYSFDYEPRSMHVYLAYRYMPAPFTPYRNVHKLQPGHLLIREGGCTRIERYWAPSLRQLPQSIDVEADRVTDAIDTSVAAQLMSDAPIGLLLSGGIDSSSVAALAVTHGETLDAFCCGFEQTSHDERPYARIAAEFTACRLHEMVMTWSMLRDRLPQFIDWFDEPFFNYSAVAIHALSCMARDRGIKVLLAGEGADELFAGYLWYDDFATYQANDQAGALDRFFGYYGMFSGQMQNELAGRNLGFDHLEVIRKYDNPDLPPVNRAQWLDFHTFLPDDILCRDDRASMAAGVELRVPYLDDHVVNNCFLLPQSLLYREHERKHLLKRALRRILPVSILTNRKKGFGFPLEAWDGEIRTLTSRLLKNGLLIAWGHASPEGITKVLKRSNINYVWLLLTAELWMRRFLNGEEIARVIGDSGPKGNGLR